MKYNDAILNNLLQELVEIKEKIKQRKKSLNIVYLRGQRNSIVNGMKICPTCQENKKVGEYYKRSNGSLIASCKVCSIKKQRVYANKYKAEIAVNQTKFREHVKLSARCKKYEEGLIHDFDNDLDEMNDL